MHDIQPAIGEDRETRLRLLAISGPSGA